MKKLERNTVHPFPARMAPGIALSVLATPKRALRVLDPMVGSGTVIAAAQAMGHTSFGLDIDPLAVLMSGVWTTPVNKTGVRKVASQVLALAVQGARKLSRGMTYPIGADDETRRFVRYWFDLRARLQLTALSIQIREVTDPDTRNVLWCAFSRLIIAKQAGASRAMDLSHSRPHRAFDRSQLIPFDRFTDAVERVLAGCLDLRSSGRTTARASVQNGDARRLPMRRGSIDLVLTSPPYLNAIDYFRCSKFTLIWMGYSLEGLRELRANSVGTEVGEKEEQEVADGIVATLRLKPALGKRHADVLRRYVVDMQCCLNEVARVLKQGGQAIYVVGENTLRGTFIPTSKILRATATSAGLSLVRRSTRMLPANKRYMPPPSKTNRGALDTRMSREVILTFEKLGS